MAWLLRGRAAVVGQREGAVALLEEALKLRPGATSACRLLAGLLYARGNRTGALEVLARQNPAADDPWLIFHFGEYHFWPERLNKVRALTW
jgi:Flp pilus assembly protein TadD